MATTTITIGSEVIEFPNSASGPNWAPALVQFAEAVETALSGLAGEYDVQPHVLTLAQEANTNLDMPLLSFATSAVRSAFIQYSIYRVSSTSEEAEVGTLEVIYNSVDGTWEIGREGTGTDNNVTFDITPAGQIRVTTTAIDGGTYTSGKISYRATAVLQSN